MKNLVSLVFPKDPGIESLLSAYGSTGQMEPLGDREV